MRRVVVTGVAVVSPLGCETSEFWDRLCTGKSGIVPLTRFDVDASYDGESTPQTIYGH